ncbi:MAG: hypothetical protein KDA30_00270 [Phycisphaerales bacterium]|nr:hypothetical protein [Phycisphaerales bacterium]
MPKIIAMWSGPRNISTAMMRAWSARPDTVVCDEPLYALYLKRTGIDHPGRDEIIRECPTDLDVIVRTLTTPPAPPVSIFYQKHMSHHLLPDIDSAWIERLTNAFLIREPRDMLTSLLRVLPSADIDATGLPQQARLFDREAQRLGYAPPVIDARDTLQDPRGILTALCESLAVEFTPSMLCWEPGPRATDGVWAKHWYAAVERSTGFSPYQHKDEEVPRRHRGLLRECQSLYQCLAEHRLRAVIG